MSLQRIYKKATRVYGKRGSENDEGEDELAIMGGQTKVSFVGQRSGSQSSSDLNRTVMLPEVHQNPAPYLNALPTADQFNDTNPAHLVDGIEGIDFDSNWLNPEEVEQPASVQFPDWGHAGIDEQWLEFLRQTDLIVQEPA